jgi:pimeloyl-ACP methyl ester carboxylesterase
MTRMPRTTSTDLRLETEPRVRRGYFECRYGQLHVHNAIPPGGGFEEGTPLLCLHGARGSGRAFTGFLALAGRDRSVYAPDLPGCGESDPPPPPATLADYIAALGDFLDSMRLRNVDVLGHGAGAVLAAELALTRPAQVRRLALMALPAGAEAGPGESADGLAAAAAGYPLRERLRKLTQSVLLVRSQEASGPDAAARLRDLVPAARVADLADAGTDPLAAAPARVAQAVGAFLRG